jgi:hypothetical protein
LVSPDLSDGTQVSHFSVARYLKNARMDIRSSGPGPGNESAQCAFGGRTKHILRNSVDQEAGRDRQSIVKLFDSRAGIALEFHAQWMNQLAKSLGEPSE